MFSKKYITVIILFVLFIPFIDKVLNLSATFFAYESENEKRTLSKEPEVNLNFLDGYPKQYEAYFNDHFMCRNFLIDQYNQLRLKVLKESPVPQKCYIGTNDWLFLNNYDYNRAHKRNLSDKDLSGFLTEFERRKTILKEQNCSLYVYIIPPKIQLYPEYKGKINSDDPAQGMQLEAYFKKNSDIPVTYLLPTLLEGKDKNAPFLFLTSDNHWSDYAAFVAYQKIIKDLKKDFPKLNAIGQKDLVSHDDVIGGGNIAIMMGANNYFKEHRHYIDVAHPQATKVEQKEYVIPDYAEMKDEYELQFENKNKDLPRLLLIRDSFGTFIIPFLSESFSHSTCIFDAWKYRLNEDIFKNEKPQIVIYLIYEPLLLNILDDLKK
jgi:hypothetical protein